MNTNPTYQPPVKSYTNLTSDSINYNYPQIPRIENSVPNVPPLMNNQTLSINQDLANIGNCLKSNAQFVQCPYCKFSGISKTEKSLSPLNLLCCLCFGPFSWVSFQAIRSKDINCYDAEHSCQRCGNKYASYQAC